MRHDPTSSSGWVRFPVGDPDYRDTGEGGLTVHALFFTADGLNHDDPFVQNAETALTVWLDGGPTRCADPHAPAVAGMFDANGLLTHDDSPDSAGIYNLLASVCLGSTGGAFCNSAGYFTCTRDDLTPDGLALVEQLERLYGRPAVLITNLDT